MIKMQNAGSEGVVIPGIFPVSFSAACERFQLSREVVALPRLDHKERLYLCDFAAVRTGNEKTSINLTKSFKNGPPEKGIVNIPYMFLPPVNAEGVALYDRAVQQLCSIHLGNDHTNVEIYEEAGLGKTLATLQRPYLVEPWNIRSEMNVHFQKEGIGVGGQYRLPNLFRVRYVDGQDYRSYWCATLSVDDLFLFTLADPRDFSQRFTGLNWNQIASLPDKDFGVFLQEIKNKMQFRLIQAADLQSRR